MVQATRPADDGGMTQTPHDTAGPGGPAGQGPRVPPAQMRDLDRLRRSATDRKIAGVAGGLARHLDVDPTVVRVLLVVLAFFGGAGLLLYAALWLFVPEEGTDEAPIGTSGETRTIVLVTALVVAAVLLVGDSWWWGGNPGWPPPLLPLALVALVVWLVVRNRGERQTSGPSAAGAGGSDVGTPPTGPAYLPPPPPVEPRPPRPRSLLGVTTAVILVALGAVASVELAGTGLPWAVYPATALGVIGAGLVASAFVGRSGGLTFLGLVAALLLAAGVWAPELRFGDLRAHPTSASGLQDRYAYTAGRIDIDLTDVRDVENLDGRVLDLDMRAGEVVVQVPPGLDVDVTSSAEGGRLDILGAVTEGRDVVNDEATPDTAAPDLRIDIDLGFGHARVSTP
jgi:phage shock protein PspC (stress-responsive transcriptional regulator)